MKVLFLTDNYMEGRAVLDPFRAELLKEFARNVDSLLYIQTSDYMSVHGFFTDGRARRHLLNEIKRFQPDLVFSLNRAGLNAEVREVVRGKVVSWFIDNPNRFAPILRTFLEGETVYCATRYMVDWLRRDHALNRKPGQEGGQGSAPDCRYLPFCTSHRIFFPDPSVPEAERCDVSFVGTLWDPAHLGSTLGTWLRSEEDKAWFQRGFERYLSEYDFDLYAYLAVRVDDLPESGDLKNLFDDFISSRQRLQVLDALAGLDLEVYGTKTWLGHALLRSKFLFESMRVRPIDTPAALSRLYQRSRTGLSIAHHQAQSGFPIRIFDILASGTPLITDRHSELNELFEEGRMFLSYGTPEEARQCVERVLKDPSLARAMGASAIAEVTGKHTFAARVREFLDLAPRGSRRAASAVTLVSEHLADEFLREDPALGAAAFVRRSLDEVRPFGARAPSQRSNPVARISRGVGFSYDLLRLSIQMLYHFFRLRRLSEDPRLPETVRRRERTAAWQRASGAVHGIGALVRMANNDLIARIKRLQARHE